ncbi:hypothetical protein [uncultured Gammaproteobacteria bacterium]|nr:hypothetical protein [uncultured Gammaproteobacteria bacterium]CAC9562086.1 hypothetical protein [uncultured Gammaproteobacteria bacterium]CAC9566857.1 hypothetical protein [uncultured Gammaproteobacteria bacterium]CAC9571046.1 hypothetical protein [uncultured Gammaproteobacteria bacterium]CAC9573759.1 hypothetical protein [uncultured Gammaproteobacteria bacterium]
MNFKTYSWMYGTTSFRVSELKYKIERQLIRLKNLYDDNQVDYNWRELQAEYLEALLDEDWFSSDANNEEKIKKYARQVTSSLSDLGLVTADRRLTNVGNELFNILTNNSFNFKNSFGIRNDSFLYLKQFLKIEFSQNVSSNYYSGFNINPFIALTYFISKYGYITKDEFQYLLPLVKNYQELQNLTIDLKNRNINTYSLIVEKIRNTPNYQESLSTFQASDKGIKAFESMLMNRRTSKGSGQYKSLYSTLMGNNVRDIIDAIQTLPGKTKTKFYKVLFNNHKKPTQANIQEAKEYFLSLKFSDNSEEKFFYLIHFAKWKTNLEEYFDNNKRFLGLTDVFIFGENIELTPIAEVYFKTINDNLLNITLSSSQEKYQELLTTTKSINDINPLLDITNAVLLQSLEDKYPSLPITGNINKNIASIIKQENKDKLNKLIDKHFSNSQLKTLLKHIKDRKNKDDQHDKRIQTYLHWECDASTIFEYIIGIIFYVMNGKTDDIHDFLNMNMDAELLPRRFAGGGQSDLVFNYGTHSALIEVTLSKKKNQRKMELEPVSRHLGRYKLSTSNTDDYAIFVAPYLDPNVLVNFRSYKNLRYYDTSNTAKYVDSLKIIPFAIDDICLIIDKGYDRATLEHKMEDSYINCEKDGLIWYENTLKPNLN